MIIDELLVCMVLFMDGVTSPLTGTLVRYALVQCHTVGTVVREEDRQVYMHGAFYGGDNC